MNIYIRTKKKLCLHFANENSNFGIHNYKSVKNINFIKMKPFQKQVNEKVHQEMMHYYPSTNKQIISSTNTDEKITNIDKNEKNYESTTVINRIFMTYMSNNSTTNENKNNSTSNAVQMQQWIKLNYHELIIKTILKILLPMEILKYIKNTNHSTNDSRKIAAQFHFIHSTGIRNILIVRWNVNKKCNQYRNMLCQAYYENVYDGKVVTDEQQLSLVALLAEFVSLCPEITSMWHNAQHILGHNVMMIAIQEIHIQQK